jgi:uncharacterized protein (PEP-CTERM system associated)
MAKSRRARAGHALPSPLAVPVALLVVLLAPPARAEWQVEPSVTLRGTYSDNVKLETAERARSQFIVDLAPSLLIRNDSPRLKLTAAASSHLYAHTGDAIDGTNSTQSQLQADARAKLIDDLLYLDGTASVGQQAISAFGPQPSNSNGYTNTNSTRVSTWRISPYLMHNFGAAATGQARYTRDSVKSGNAGLGDSTSDALALSLDSGSAFRTVGWGLQANRQDVHDSLGRDYQIETANASVHLRTGHTLTLDASGGYDKYDYSSPGGVSSGASHSLGFTWTPSLRTRIQLSAGKRYFGPSYLLALSHRSRRTVWSANYNDAVTTTRDQLFIPAAVNAADMLDRLFSASIADPVARRLAVDAFIRANGLPPSLAHNVNYFSNRFILQRQFQASAAFNTARTTSVVAINANKREALSSLEEDRALAGTAPLTLNDNTRQAGASVLVSYRLSPRSAVSASANSNRTESLSTGIKSNQRTFNVSLTRQFQSKLKAVVEVRRNQGDMGLAGSGKYRENAVSASLSYQL